ncbi:protein-glutamine gamma-glutamyltransferase 5-like [Heteronotia binoei]|uniref:protein-glutamine gamma-glutamyltransferase 5-like n=1 Tax=Heteronotia binoei TaxID=13085 RepID=UPI00292F2A60|nr:protein-glutamine gamma-glutamyltransferase 5-like [Heteronotia binoei]
MEALKVKSVDLNCLQNCSNHHTQYFGAQKLIVRRGQAFGLYLHFQNRDWDDDKDKITFTVETGIKPCESLGTKSTFPLGGSTDQNLWSACYKQHNEKCLSVNLLSPVNACVGCYLLNMCLISCDDTHSHNLGEFYVLFNPWCSEDPVYLEEQAHREEYILNEHGIVFQGLPKHITSHAWHFGQFQDDILEICLKILDSSTNFLRDPGMDCSCRNDAAYICRVLNNMICCHKKKSILKLPPNNNYLQGVNPSMWNGSIPILRQWYHNKCKPVKHGHCGILAAVMCTVMRCLGIPSRVVTGFYCPLNAVDPLIIQEVFDFTGKTLNAKEHIWRYHCWNESWMARKDISQSRGDWQYLDPTPIETNKGSMCSGPIWVKSIRDGDVDIDSDGPHVFGLLNARYTAWVSQGKGKKIKLHCETRPCGQCISTKSVGSDLREDITDAYKYELGSVQEKKALYKACRKINSRYLNAPNSEIDKDLASQRNKSLKDIGITMKFKMANCPLYGQDIQMHWVLKNLCNEAKDKKFNLCAQATMYNGCSLNQVWKDNIHVTLGPKEVKSILITIPYEDYGSHLCDNNIMRVIAVSMPERKGEVMMVERDVLVDSLPVKIKILDHPRMNMACSAEVIFSNPLKEDLKNCKLYLEGYGLIGEPTATELGTLSANHMAQTCVEFTPYKYGRHQFMASISCDKFCNCKGYASIDMGSPPTTSGEGGA